MNKVVCDGGDDDDSVLFHSQQQCSSGWVDNVVEKSHLTYIEHDQVTRVKLRASYVYELIVQNTTVYTV